MVEYSFFKKIKIFLNNVIELFNNLDKNKKNNIKNAILVTDEKSEYFFHFLIDSLQRLQLYKDSSFSNLDFPVLLEKKLYELDFIKTSLDTFNLKYELVENNQIYKINKLIVPYHLTNSGNYNVEVVKNLNKRFIEMFSDNLTSRKRKIWISRQNARIRKIKNYLEIEDILKKFGFEILEFENVSNFSEQIKIIRSASVIGSIHGGGLSNMLFLDERCSVIEVRGEADSHNNCYFSLASALNLNYYFLPSKVTNDDFYHGDYYINPDTITAFLKKYFN